jgi:hypothetical protein
MTTIAVTLNETLVKKAVTLNETLIKKVKVGTPVRSIVESTNNINGLEGISTLSKVNGSVLVYNGTSDKWEATLDLEQQNINGGSY